MLDIILNLLPLIASVTLILVFRYLDKDNRSIEGAKRFIDGAKGQFDKYFQENTKKRAKFRTLFEIKSQLFRFLPNNALTLLHV